MPVGPKCIVVSGIGMSTPVGRHAVQACASVRAGITRFAEWPYFQVTSEDGAVGLTASFFQPDLLLGNWCEKAYAMSHQAIAEAVFDAGLYDLERTGGRVGLFIATPGLERRGVDPEDHESFVADVREGGLLAVTPAHHQLIAQDHVGGTAAIARAVQALNEQSIDVAIVGGLDSLLEDECLEQLFAGGRLKTPNQPSGLIPGEGAAFALLERAGDLSRRHGKALGRLAAVVLGTESTPLGPEHGIRADGLTAVIRQVLAESGNAGDIHLVINDLNGERWRFLEWAMAETRSLAVLPNGWRLEHPADVLGDVGAAFGPSALCLSVRALARGYAGGKGVLVTSASLSGGRGAFTIFAPEA